MLIFSPRYYFWTEYSFFVSLSLPPTPKVNKTQLFYSWDTKNNSLFLDFHRNYFQELYYGDKNDMFIWWAILIVINHGVWCLVYWITILSLQFSLGLKSNKARFNFCKICLSCLMLQLRLVVFSIKKSHNSRLFFYLLIYLFDTLSFSGNF